MTAQSAAASASAALAAALLACPSCGAKLSRFLGESEAACTGCEATFPVFADVPVLMADPVAYVAEHRTAILSALAELAECTPTELATVERWARRRGATTQRLFDDDFTRPEEHGSTPSLATNDEGFLAFARGAAQATPLSSAAASARAAAGPHGGGGLRRGQRERHAGGEGRRIAPHGPLTARRAAGS
jgi:uncharacterized protein YbaR (Trm112 family)